MRCIRYRYGRIICPLFTHCGHSGAMSCFRPIADIPPAAILKLTHMMTALAIVLASASPAPVAAVPLVKSNILLGGGDAVEDTDWRVRPWLTASELKAARALGDPFAIVHCTALGKDGRLAKCRSSRWQGSRPVADTLALAALKRARVDLLQARERGGRDVWITTTFRLLGGNSFPRGPCPPTWCRVEPPPPPPPPGQN